VHVFSNPFRRVGPAKVTAVEFSAFMISISAVQRDLSWHGRHDMSKASFLPEWVLGILLAVGTLTLGVVWAVDFVRASYEPAVVQVEAGGTAKLHGTFRSPWKETVTVKHVVAGCSCSQADVKPRRIEPGAVVEVDAVFDSTGKPAGDHAIALRIIDADGDDRDIPWPFRVKVLAAAGTPP